MTAIKANHPDDVMILLRLRDLRKKNHYGEITLKIQAGRIVLLCETVTVKVPLDNSEAPCNTESRIKT